MRGSLPVTSGAAASGAPGPPFTGTAPDGRRAAPGPAVVVATAGGCYLALAVGVWWHVWSTHPTSTSVCACGDPGLITWFLAWPAYAMAHGLDPFFSSFMYHPYGVNLLANTSSLLAGVVLAPVTWLFGPIATLNVALTLAPALTALSTFWLVRRWTHWAPAAFTSGLVTGFSPFMVGSLAEGHVMTSALTLLPLFVAALDELLVRQRHRPLWGGAGLAALVVLQFFLSTEILAIVAVSAAGAVVLLVVHGLLWCRHALRRRVRHALAGLGVAAVSGAAVLAYPVWFALDGPAHIPGQIWAGIDLSKEGTTWRGLLGLAPTNRAGDLIALAAGYVGRPLPDGAAVGIGALVVAALGLALWRRDRALWCFTAVGALTAVLSAGTEPRLWWAPWRALAGAALLRNVIPVRFMAVALLCLAVVVGIVVDHVHDAVAGSGPGPAARGRTLLAGAGAAVVALGAVVPMATTELGVLPLVVTPIGMPRWYAQRAPDLAPGEVVVAFPHPGPGSYGRILAWQAVDGMRFLTAEGAGPETSRVPAIPYSQGIFQFPPAPPTPSSVTAMRRALLRFGVTLAVLVPARGGRVPLAADANLTGIVTEALGRGPALQSGALVWRVAHPRHTLVVAPSLFARCTAFGPGGATDLVAEARCLLAPGHGGRGGDRRRPGRGPPREGLAIRPVG